MNRKFFMLVAGAAVFCSVPAGWLLADNITAHMRHDYGGGYTLAAHSSPDGTQLADGDSGSTSDGPLADEHYYAVVPAGSDQSAKTSDANYWVE
ncbi:hypothetical protein GCM10023219_14760 [Stakelama sediminis]|uniref:Secreted protein n=1 Tax=Stakelama sediminis TaxID=463200 RepID=A0A840YX29_9SPHN|nr:hypothetical protein [Stakelama sediminis]MBB5718203.1 hypothetical protein [Stakelama sediminis]